jgi:hypothetical protein
MSELKLKPGWLARDVARASERADSWRSEKTLALNERDHLEQQDRKETKNQVVTDQRSK